jgi:FkbM family methyltransferase
MKETLLPLRKAKRFFLFKVRRLIGTIPCLPVSRHSLPLLKFGTESYGGWTFVDSEELKHSTIVSCGLGEDASFEVEFASNYSARVVIVDPTPRAVVHFDLLLARIGEPSLTPYADSGKESPGAYDMRKIHISSFIFIKKAIWNSVTTLRFFEPKDPAHVSHSIVNFQNSYSVDSSFIEVDAVTISEVLKFAEIETMPLIKLDIEGAEIEVVLDLLSKSVFPRQILIEYDEMSVPSRQAARRISNAHVKLLSSRYSLIHWDGSCNFLYYRDL